LLEEIAAASAARHGNLKLAGKHLRRALEIDASDRMAWNALAEVLRLSGDNAGRARLGADYERRFGKPLPVPH
jgi:Flp pilus assembly protein TadD